MLTVDAFLNYAIPDTMMIAVFESLSEKYKGVYDVQTCYKTFEHRQMDSFNIKGGCLCLYLEEEDNNVK